MHATGITANLSVADLVETRHFYADFLGLNVEGFDLGDLCSCRRSGRGGVRGGAATWLRDVHPLTVEPGGPQVLRARARRQHRQP